jgi:hypothetical protein
VHLLQRGQLCMLRVELLLPHCRILLARYQ